MILVDKLAPRKAYLLLVIHFHWAFGGPNLNAELIGDSYASAVEAADSRRKSMDAQRIAIDAVVALTDCDREQVTAFIRKLYLAGVKDPKRLTFKGLQALAQG